MIGVTVTTPPPAGALALLAAVTCGACRGQTWRGRYTDDNDLGRRLIAADWTHTSEHGWICPACAGRKGAR